MHRTPVTGPDRMPAEGDVTRSYTHAGRRLHVAGGSRVGNRYAANFDVLHVDPTLPFLAVADGMGDGRGSTVAGSTTMQTMVAAVQAAGHDIGPGQLRAAMAEAQFRVRTAGAELGELTGCTFTGMVLAPTAAGSAGHGTPAEATPQPAPGAEPPTAGQRSWLRRTPPSARTAPDASDRGDPAAPEPAAWIVQIGDSRAYRLRDGLLELLTVDHTAAWLGAVYGWYPADSPAAAAARYQLTRYVGHPGNPEPDLLSVTLRPGDVYCLCTDGVAEQVDYQRLANRLGASGSPVEVSRAILADTLVAGGRDNATIAVLRVEN
ncbi:serine/threonine-protein phosphatase [Plantactinospora sp. S1510]|uniref:Serine/threonine-protein phosphatase n=1 Tax=Plantactinospora alkalitolerans TaxID=2789879 RepID=A0ABS0H339_9ACTN|nr:serine/threonine-protein phosphatase [Plantactinospora alkalitolerans]MBF9132890.1 serine/threonine-protein phosphatase [Plantactinospora alkalitolerans]